MSGMVSLVGEVEQAIASGDQGRRMDSLRRMTDLFVHQAPSLNEAHVGVFDEVILRLARDMEFRARIELSDRLADVGNAPRGVVKDLALDDNIAVAQPVLARSSRLTEEDLVEVAEKKSQDHLLALTQRPTLSERVTDVLVDRGNEQVVRQVAANDGARFSERGFGTLVERAKADAQLQDSLKVRADLPKERMRQLVEIARERAAASLKAELGGDARIEAALGQASQAMQGEAGPALLGDLAAVLKRLELNRQTLNEANVVAWIKHGKVEEALAAMSQIAGVPADTAARAYHAATYDPLLVLARAARFNWNTFKLLLTHKAGRIPPVDVLKAAFESFQQLTVPTAQRVARFSAARDSAARSDAA